MSEQAEIGHNNPPEPTFPENMEAAKAIVKAEKLKAEGHTPDLSTSAGRDATIAAAAAVTKKKTQIDKEGLSMTAEWRKKTEDVNKIRKFIKDELSVVSADIRKPVTDWEDRQEQIKAAIEANIEAMKAINVDGLACELIRDQIDELEGLECTEEDYGDQWSEAEVIRQAKIKELWTEFRAAEKREADAAELQKLREAEAERERAHQAEIARMKRESAEKQAAIDEERRALEAEKAAHRQQMIDEQQRKDEADRQRAAAIAAAAEPPAPDPSPEPQQPEPKPEAEIYTEHQTAWPTEQDFGATGGYDDEEPADDLKAGPYDQTFVQIVDMGISELSAAVLLDAIIEGQFKHLKFEATND